MALKADKSQKENVIYKENEKKGDKNIVDLLDQVINSNLIMNIIYYYIFMYYFQSKVVRTNIDGIKVEKDIYKERILGI